MKNKVGIENQTNKWFKQERNSGICKELLRDYSSHATLHGIGYLGSKNTTLPEKIYWLIIFLASLSFCLYLISVTWIRWQNNPVILNFEKEQRPIWSIPFPSVTVCPLNKVRQTYYNYSYYFHQRHNLSEQEYKKFWDISLICELDKFEEDFFSTINITDEYAIKNIRDVAQGLQTTIYLGKWLGKRDDTLFEEHVNKEGMCFTFNALSQDDIFTEKINFVGQNLKNEIRTSQWNMEDGYKTYLDMDAYPRRTAQEGHKYGLSFALVSFILNYDYTCGLPFNGFKIILHNPTETAKAAQQFLFVGPDKTATIMIKPQLVTTPIELQSMDPHVRKCYFSYEKSLKFFKVYTQNNCQIECTANVTEKYCGCVPFYMPRAENSKICGFGKMKCLDEIEKKLLLFGLLEKSPDTSNQEMQTEEYKIFNKCDCIAACNDLQFSAEISYASMHIDQTLKSSSLWKTFPPIIKKYIEAGIFKASVVEIFYKESQFLALTRSDLYARNDFAADCGGLLGLFLGFSLLSLMEMIYFLTLRLWCKIRKIKSND